MKSAITEAISRVPITFFSNWSLMNPLNYNLVNIVTNRWSNTPWLIGLMRSLFEMQENCGLAAFRSQRFSWPSERPNLSPKLLLLMIISCLLIRHDHCKYLSDICGITKKKIIFNKNKKEEDFSPNHKQQCFCLLKWWSLKIRIVHQRRRR